MQVPVTAIRLYSTPKHINSVHEKTTDCTRSALQNNDCIRVLAYSARVLQSDADKNVIVKPCLDCVHNNNTQKKKIWSLG